MKYYEQCGSTPTVLVDPSCMSALGSLFRNLALVLSPCTFSCLGSFY